MTTPTEMYAPSIFMSDYEVPPTGSQVIPPLPRSEGGLIESVKTAIVQALRTAMSGTSLFDSGQAVYIDLEYPSVQTQYPGIWVQFSVTKLNRAGIAHEVPVQDKNGKWSFVEEWIFTGRVTLTIAALKSRDRDKIADALIMQLAFSRTPERVLTKPHDDTKRYRSLVAALDANPYIAMTIQTDVLTPGGQQVTQGVPWGDNVLGYEDSYSFDLVGNFNVQFANDGLYILSRINPVPTLMETEQPYNPAQWLGNKTSLPLNGGLRYGGEGNSIFQGNGVDALNERDGTVSTRSRMLRNSMDGTVYVPVGVLVDALDGTVPLPQAEDVNRPTSGY